MNFIVDTKISKDIPEPILISGKNIGGSTSLFFHGTTKKACKNILEEGFQVTPSRPMFSASPNYSLAYCRKSESYIRGLIAKDKKEELEREIAHLIDEGVVTKKDLDDTDHQWWISKADDFYKTTVDIVQNGVLLAFQLNPNHLKEPKEGVLQIKKKGREAVIVGAPSYWRTRQFALKGSSQEIVSSKDVSQLIIRLNKSTIEAIKGLDSKTKEGKLKKDHYRVYTAKLGACLEYEIKNSTIPRSQIIESFVDQIVESSFIKNLRDAYVAKCKLLGFKIYWVRNKSFLEDPRWDMSPKDLEQCMSALRENQYFKKQWADYVIHSIKKTKSLE